jgi:hypothetical protein
MVVVRSIIIAVAFGVFRSDHWRSIWTTRVWARVLIRVVGDLGTRILLLNFLRIIARLPAWFFIAPGNTVRKDGGGGSPLFVTIRGFTTRAASPVICFIAFTFANSTETGNVVGTAIEGWSTIGVLTHSNPTATRNAFRYTYGSMTITTGFVASPVFGVRHPFDIIRRATAEGPRSTTSSPSREWIAPESPPQASVFEIVLELLGLLSALLAGVATPAKEDDGEK